MHVSIIAFGTRGDIQPFVAYGRALQAAGHTVRVVTQASFCNFVSGYGLACAPVAIDLRAAWSEQKKAGIELLPMLQTVRRDVGRALKQMWAASQDAEAVVFNYLGRIPGMSIVEKLGVPAFLGLIHPHQMDFFYRFRYFNDVGEPVINVREAIIDRLMQLSYTWMMNRWRKKVLELPYAPLIGNDRAITAQHIPVLCSWSPAVYPQRPEWPEHFHLTGYWFLDHPASWRPPADLMAFLESGPPPVYVGFSGVTHLEREDMTALILDGLAQAGQRGLLASGWSDLGHHVPLPDSVYVMDAVPHDWLFPQLAVAVHHGGVGTTAAAFRAGIPSVVIPFVVDEPFWAWKISQLGAGPPGIPPKKLTAARLAEAIDIALHDTGMKQRAADLSARICAEDGLSRAVMLFEEYVKRGS